MGLMKNFFQQTRKPEGLLGKMMVGGMNGGGHAKLADWGMSHLGETEPTYIAELGCGGGRNAGELLKRYPSARLTALDYSDVSVASVGEFSAGTGFVTSEEAVSVLSFPQDAKVNTIAIIRAAQRIFFMFFAPFHTVYF